MADLVAVVGASGSGKSTSLRNMNPVETFIINVAGKPLPFRGWRSKYKSITENKETGNYLATNSVINIQKILAFVAKNRPEIKNVVIEDAQYLMAFEAMDRAEEKNFDKFVQIASNFYKVLKAAMDLREDMKVFVLTHEENTGDAMNPKRKIKTQGRMLDNVLTIEGLFTYVLFTDVTVDESNGKSEYKFITNNDGTTTAKTPVDCFTDVKIDNDLQFVIDAIDEYNEG